MQKGHKTTKRGINVNPKFGKRLSALLLSAAVAAGSVVSAGACCGLYIGSDETVTGSTYVGRSEDIGKLYDKVFEVIPAADHAAGAMYEDSYGFSMPYPAHTYRYTVMRDSVNRGETMTDANGNIIEIAYGEVGMNEKGVAVSATVSTDYNKAAEAADSLNADSGLCEISLNSVILMQADSARDGVEKLAKILDKHGAGECNSLTISDADEVWDFEILSGYQYVAVKMPKDKVSVNPNMVIMNEIDTADTENVIASKDLIALPQEKGFLVSSQVPATGVPAGQKITKIDIQKTYGAEDFGDGQYVRYWQGVNYLNKTLSNHVDIYRANADTVPSARSICCSMPTASSTPTTRCACWLTAARARSTTRIPRAIMQSATSVRLNATYSKSATICRRHWLPSSGRPCPARSSRFICRITPIC